LETLNRRWWIVVLRGVAAVLFGVLALVWPGITLLALVLLFGVYVLVDGLLSLAVAIRRGPVPQRGWLIVEGIASLVIGIAAFVWPGITSLVLLGLIAGWSLVTGVLEIAGAIALRRELRHEWLLALAGALSVVFGILILVWPAAGALALVTLIGVYAIVFGVTLIGLGIRLRRVRHEIPVSGAHRPATA
jgi:uncharacterized membrane protein HdeD (DUF308 family)